MPWWRALLTVAYDLHHAFAIHQRAQRGRHAGIDTQIGVGRAYLIEQILQQQHQVDLAALRPSPSR
jgi:hypothetical protein